MNLENIGPFNNTNSDFNRKDSISNKFRHDINHAKENPEKIYRESKYDTTTFEIVTIYIIYIYLTEFKYDKKYFTKMLFIVPL